MRQYFEKYFFILGDKRKELLFLLFLFLLSSLFDLFGLGLIGPFIASLSSPNELSKYAAWNTFIDVTGMKNNQNGIVLLGVIIVLTIYTKGLSAFWVQKKIAQFSYKHMAELRSKLMKTYQAMPYLFHIKRNSASMINRIIGHVGVYTQLTLMTSLRLVSDIVVFLTITAFLAFTDYGAMLIMIGLFIGVFLLYDKLVKHRMQTVGRVMAETNEEIIKGAKQGIDGFKEIRVLGREEYFHNKVFQNALLQSDAASEFQWLQYVPRHLIESAMITFVVLLASINILMSGNVVQLMPTLGVFAFAAMRLMPSGNTIIVAINNIRNSVPVVNDLYQDLKELQESGYLVEPGSVLNLGNAGKTSVRKDFSYIELQDVDYRYPETKENAIKNVSMHIARGQVVGLIGKSGSGKTTLVNVLLGLLKPQRGQIIVDGVSIFDDLRRWLDNVAYIPQNVFLIDDTLRKNIALGVQDEEIDGKKLRQAIKMAQLESVVEQMPDGENSIIGENGIRLSGGQRQRIDLARAFYYEREIIIMDEATSALDNETERQVVEAINNLKGKKTIIVIAHRLSTVKYCDTIYRLDSGSIVDVGDYQKVVGEAT